MDYGPEDRHKRFTAPALWLYARPTRGGTGAASAVEKVPSGSPFLDQFSRYFPDLRARPINAGHFFIEEAPEPTNRFLLEFLKGRI
jgi:pimeloyl-ACP methyl ester carboxylesterase